MGDSEVYTFALANGLRVVLAPDNTVPIVGVSVHYDVGLRSEPVGFAGFSHLFERLMFHGSESVGDHGHTSHMRSCGGRLGSSTFMDYTNYFSVVPSPALERALFLEADRMRAPRLTEQNVRQQVDVVKREVGLNVLDRSRQAFPWNFLAPLLYRTFRNVQDGNGEFTDLDEVSLQRCAAFFDTFYAPGNAVLSIAGDFTVDEACGLVEEHFGDVPGRQLSQRPVFADIQQQEIRGELFEPHAPLPALAVGYQLPDLIDELHGYLANVVLAAALSDGGNARFQQAMRENGTVIDIDAVCGNPEPFGSRHPEMFTISLTHLFRPDRERLLELVDRELELLSRHPPDDELMRRVVGRLTADHYSQRGSLENRACALGKFELLYNDARILDQLVSGICRITAEDVAAAAGALKPDRRAVLILTASGGTP